MKKNLLAILMLAGILFATSCGPEEVEEPTLQLSETGIIVLPKSASEKAITVTTNQTEWTFTTNANWIELAQSGKTLTIKTGENFTCDKRKAEVMIIAGNIGKKLAVEQSESELTIVTIPDKLEVNQWGGNFQFDVVANSNDWNVSSNVEWLKVTPKQFKNEIAVAIEENTSRKTRTAILTISRDGNTNLKEITIVQNGILHYILPYLEVETSLGKIIEFETARKSVYIPQLVDHLFDTKSSVFHSIWYSNTNNFTSRVEMIASSDEFIKDPEFEKMMLDAGFEQLFEKVYRKKSSPYVIEAIINDGTTSNVVFTFNKEQPGPMPTFEKFPYSFMHFDAEEGTLEKVRAWENENGGVYSTNESIPEQGFYWFDASSPWLFRAYFFSDKPYLVQSSNGFTDISKFFYKAGSKYIMTEEFSALKNKEGFTSFLGEMSGFSFYSSSDSPYELAIGVMKYPDVNNGEEIVEMRFNLAYNSNGSGVLRDSQRNKKNIDTGTKAIWPSVLRIEK